MMNSKLLPGREGRLLPSCGAGAPALVARTRGNPRLGRLAAALVFASIGVPAANAALVVTLDVPELPAAGSKPGLEFLSFQFVVDMKGVGDPVPDYAANVLANDHEYFTYLERPSCGRGCILPPVRVGGSTYSATYQPVTSPPTQLQAHFVFWGTDVAGKSLTFAVADSPAYSLTLKDAKGNVIAAGAPLSNELYMLDYETDGFRLGDLPVTITATVPEPATALLFVPGLLILTAVRSRAGGSPRPCEDLMKSE